MILHWYYNLANGAGAIRNFDIGGNIAGLTLNGKRPNTVEFDAEDLRILLDQPPELLVDYLHKVRVALKPVSATLQKNRQPIEDKSLD